MTEPRAYNDVYKPEPDFSLTPLTYNDDPERLRLIESNTTYPLESASEPMLGDELAAEPSDAPSAEDEESGWSIVRELIETVVLSLLIFLLIRGVVQNYRIESLSMQPNFFEGQFILVNKLAYRLGEPERGDVVVFQNPNNASEDYIKRIIGLPGDTIEIREQQIILNGRALDEPYETEPIALYDQSGPFVVEPDHIFVMGDNRPNSSDSRAIGAIDQELVVGKAWVRVYPFSDWGAIRHYDLNADLTLDLPVEQSASPIGASP